MEKIIKEKVSEWTSPVVEEKVKVKPDIKGGGLRYNQGKLRYDLLEPYALEQLAAVFTKGAEKYAPRNWEKGMLWSNVIASLKRHLAAIEKGEDYDKESGLLHAAHVSWNAMALTSYYKIFPQGDDRKHGYLNLPKIGLDIDGVIADFTGHLLKRIGHEGHVAHHWNDPIIRKGFEEHKHDPQFWADLPPLISRDDICFEPHCYITARSIDASVTQEWLDRNLFPTAKVYSIGIGESKIDVAKESGVEVFVDDNFDNFVALNKAGICTFLYDTPYNEKYDVGYKRVKSLKEVFDRFK